MKIIQLTYLMVVLSFLSCQEEKTTPLSHLITLSANEAHQKGIDFYTQAADTNYKVRQQLADSAIYYFKYELQLRKQEFGENHWRTHKVQLNLGVIYQHDRADLVTAQTYYEAALFNSKTDTTGMNTIAPFLEAEILYNSGVVLERLGEYQLAKAHAKHANELYEPLKIRKQTQNSTDFENYIYNLLNLGDIHAALKEPIAIHYFNDIETIRKKHTISSSALFGVYLNRGIAHRLLKSFDMALSDLTKATAIAVSTTLTDYQANVNIELAKLYLDKNNKTQFQIAEAYALKSLKLRSDYPKGHVVFAEIYTVLGQIYLKINQLDKAKKAFQDALGDANSKSYRSNWQMEALSQLADLQTPSDASHTYETLSEMLYQRKSFFKTDAAKLDLTQQARKIYQKSIHLNHQLFGETGDKKYLNRELTDMERSKSVLLSEMIQDTRIKSYYDVPNEVREKERKLKLAIAQAERKLNQDTITFQTNQTDLSTKYSEWQGFVQELKQKYPKYYALKHAEPQLLEIQTVQKQLPDSSLLVNYYMADSTLHILAINQSSSKSYQLPLTKQFDTVYNQYQRLLAQKTWDWKQNPVFSKASYQLYQYLLEEPLQDFKTRHLIIIPDAQLASLSFSALFTKDSILNDDHKEPYLINDYSVNMAYTLNDCGLRNADFGINAFIPQSAIHNPQSKFVYAGLSHNFNLNYQDHLKPKELSKLWESQKHIKHVRHLFELKKPWRNFIDTAMTLTKFKTVVQQSRITELITHAGFDEHDARKAVIAFPNPQGMDWLEIKEIYNLDCTVNELLTLIACETGRGLPIQGETVISMAYAFAYSGARRRVSALWSIPHLESMELMNAFFKNVVEKQVPAVALQKAQIEFLNSKRSARQQTPNLWAGLILSGNIRAISQ
jgi:CHAT domain-containing protein